MSGDGTVTETIHVKPDFPPEAGIYEFWIEEVSGEQAHWKLAAYCHEADSSTTLHSSSNTQGLGTFYYVET